MRTVEISLYDAVAVETPYIFVQTLRKHNIQGKPFGDYFLVGSYVSICPESITNVLQ